MIGPVSQDMAVWLPALQQHRLQPYNWPIECDVSLPALHACAEDDDDDDEEEAEVAVGSPAKAQEGAASAVEATLASAKVCCPCPAPLTLRGAWASRAPAGPCGSCWHVRRGMR